MTGWRLGWLVLPSVATPEVDKLVEFNTSCAPVFIQRAGLALERTVDITPRVVAHLKLAATPWCPCCRRCQGAGGPGRRDVCVFSGWTTPRGGGGLTGRCQAPEWSGRAGPGPGNAFMVNPGLTRKVGCAGVSPVRTLTAWGTGVLSAIGLL
jgi:hypothetical protein